MAEERVTQAQEALDSLKAEGADPKEIEAATFVVKRANMAFRHVQAFDPERAHTTPPSWSCAISSDV